MSDLFDLIGPKPIAISDLAMRAINRPGAWLVLMVKSPREVPPAVEELAAELELMSQGTPQTLQPSSPLSALAQAFADAEPGELILHGLDALSARDWEHIDQQRSQYRREQGVILVIPEDSMTLLMQRAPNLASWIGGAAWAWDQSADDLSSDEREQRLAALRQWAGFADHELIRRAEAGELPSEPEYAEWLALIGRGELITRG